MATECRTSTEERSPTSGVGCWASGVGRSFPSLIALGVVCAIYVTALSTLTPSVFWSPDEGAKFIQLHSWLVDASASHRLAYGAVSSDPAFAFYPTAAIYPRPLWPTGVHNHWPGLFPLVSLPLHRLFGLWGLYAIPLACGVLSAAAAGCVARRLEPDAALPAVLLAGLCAPSFFLSVLFFEHTLAGLLGLGALWCGLNAHDAAGPRRFAYALAALAGLAGMLALRGEAVILCGAFAGAGLLALGRGRIGGHPRPCVVVVVLSVAVLLLLALPGTGRLAKIVGDTAGALAGLRDPALWYRLPQHVLEVLVNNPGQSGVPLDPEWAVAGLAGLGLCAISAIALPRWRFLCWSLGAGLVGAASAIGLCLPDRYRAVHGLLLPVPGLVLAWLPTGDDGRPTGRAERFLVALLPVYLILYVFTTWLVRRSTGGPEWGLRYALMAYLLAAVLGSIALVRFTRANRGWRRFAGLGLALAFFALSCGYGLRGVFEVQVTKRDLQAFDTEIRNAACPVVTDQWWLAAALTPTFVGTDLYTVNGGNGLDAWLERIGSRAPSFLYVTYKAAPDAMTTAQGLTATLTQRRVVQGMTFSRFAVKRQP